MEAATETAPVASAPPKTKTMLPVMGLKRLESAQLAYRALVPVGHTLEMLLDPLYWGHHAKGLKLWSFVVAIAEDGSFDADLRVVAHADTWAKMRPLRVWQEAPGKAVGDPTPVRARYRHEFVGGTWRVVSDMGKVVEKGFTNKDDAIRYIEKLVEKLSTKQ